MDERGKKLVCQTMVREFPPPIPSVTKLKNGALKPDRHRLDRCHVYNEEFLTDSTSA